jgi:hypothetical protein
MTGIHFVDRQNTDGTCSPVYTGTRYQDANVSYRIAIDNANDQVANISWYFGLGDDQQHIGTRKFRNIEEVTA